MTFEEFGARLTDAPVMLLPFGSQEEQGPHAPMGDFMLTEAIAALAAERSGAIAAPTLPFGHADFFRSFAGGIQLRTATFKAVVEDVATAFLDHGVDRLVIINGHTTNAFLIDEVMRKLREERGVTMASINIWQCLRDEDWAAIHGENRGKVRGHGADPVTSAYWHLFPNLMRPDLYRPSADKQAFGLPTMGPMGVRFDGAVVNMPISAREANASGMMGGGDASHSSAAAGAQIVERIVSHIDAFVRHFRSCDPHSLAAPGAIHG